MTRLRIGASGALRGRVSLPGDLHIGQQALVWAALSTGTCTLSGYAPRSDHRLLAAALRELGVAISEVEGGFVVRGVGLRGLTIPKGALFAGDSVSTLELLVTLLSAQQFGTRVEAAGAALAHSLRTLIGPLRDRGAHVSGRRSDDGDARAPVSVAPLFADERLEGVEITIPTGDPTTKLGLLLSGLYARGPTVISESMLSRDHAERALVALGTPLQTAAGMTLLEGDPFAHGEASRWPAFTWALPGDFTLASYVVAAALALEGSHVAIDGVGLNPTRTAFLEALRGTGARVSVTPKGDAAGNEPVGELRVQSSRLTRVRVGGERAFGLLDEAPAVIALALACSDRLSLRDVGALRAAGPDGLKALSSLLAQFGVDCTRYEDGLELDPPAALTGAHLTADIAPPLKLLGCILGMRASGVTLIEGSEQLDVLYPGFLDALIKLGASITREEGP